MKRPSEELSLEEADRASGCETNRPSDEPSLSAASDPEMSCSLWGLEIMNNESGASLVACEVAVSASISASGTLGGWTAWYESAAKSTT
jgi:hypothetical protein